MVCIYKNASVRPPAPCRGFAFGPHWGLCPSDPLTHFAVPPPLNIFPKFTPMTELM